MPSTRLREDWSRRVVSWVLLGAGRWALALWLSGAFFVFLLVGNAIAPAPIDRVIQDGQAMGQVYTTMALAVITAVVLVGTFNQLVLSQELGSLGDQRERMEGATAFRSDAQRWLDVPVSPPDPGRFLAAILASVQRTAADLHASTSEGVSESEDQLRAFCEEIGDHANRVREDLEESEFGTFEVVDSALNFDYSWYLYEARRLRIVLEEDIDEETAERISDLASVLEVFAPAREHFKTTYFQWELMNLSRSMLYSSVPALIIALGMTYYVDPASVQGTIVGIDSLVILISITSTFTLLPFFLFVTYVLRISTVAKRTLAMGPFVLQRESQ